MLLWVRNLSNQVILEATSLVKFRNRLGSKGMKEIEAVLLKTWGDMGLLRTKKIVVDTTALPENIAYPTDVDLLHRVREKIVQHTERVREEVTLRKPFRSFSRVSKRILLGVKKFNRRDPEKRAKALQALQRVVSHVVHQANRVILSLYVRRRKDLARPLQQLASTGLWVVRQTEEVLQGQKTGRRVYSLHETEVAVIKKGKSHPECEFGSLVAMAINEDGLLIAHEEYQKSLTDVKTLNPLLRGVQANAGNMPLEFTADRGFSRSYTRKRVGAGVSS